eukprot:TRINITY_DN10327_c0_g1_i1.p1 TRINITY_DN10327_c0_g1~~TRINITY_DN10327_c0_g1_i1.p1  ORF type:complete len:635 (-),score=155.44 TRINITY_DN10327_c0_g1_i1:13-1893(-)
MQRHESLPEIYSERGRGLADLKGWDPLDRRLEVEKKEKYGQALRDQMNSARGPGSEASSSSRPPSWGGRASPPMRAAGEYMAGLPPRGDVEVMRMPAADIPPSPGPPGTPLLGAAAGSSDSVAAAKVAQVQELMRQRLQAVQEEQQRQWQEVQHALSGQLQAAREAAEQSVRKEFGLAMQDQASELDELRTALSQAVQARQRNEEQSVQRAEVMASELADAKGALQRLQMDHASELDELRAALSQAAQARQRNEEQSVQHAEVMASELADAKGALQRLQSESEGWRSQLQGLGRAVDDLTRAGKASEELAAQRLQSAVGELAEARGSMQRLEAQMEGWQSRLQGQAQEIESLRCAKQECARAHEACERERAELSRRQDQAEAALADVRRQLQDHGIEIDRLKVAHDDCAAARVELQKRQRASDERLEQVLSEQGRFSAQLAEVQSLASRLRDEVPRLAERAALRALEGMERVRPEVRPPTPPPSLPAAPEPSPEVSESAYAVLRGSEGELYELPSLENVVGRSTACDTCVAGSQAVSNKHMSIGFASDGTASIKDLGSRNGTFLNDHRVAGPGLVMKSGDKVQLGVDGPSLVFSWGPAHFARWPREHERATGGSSRGRSSSRMARR